MKRTYRIVATRPQLDLVDQRREIGGALLYKAVQHALPHLEFVKHSKDEAIAAIKEGNFSFVFNDKGQFISESLVPLPKREAKSPKQRQV